MNGLEFIAKVNANEDGTIIKSGTEFQVFDNEGNYIGFVGVSRGHVNYFEMDKVPDELYSENYTFKEIVNE